MIKKHIQFSIENCKSLDARVYFKPDNTIKSVKLNKSYKISELYDDPDFRQHLIFLFVYKLYPSHISIVNDYLDNNHTKSDIEIYTEIRDIILNKIKPVADKGYNRIQNIKKHIDLSELVVEQYLDIGCFDGEITKAIGNHFKLPSHKIFGLDIKEYPCNMDNGFIFNTYDKKNLPYDDNSFDLISILMVLHHVQPEDLDPLLNDISRVMKSGGVLIVREHDINPLLRLSTHLIDVLHSFHDIVLNPSLDQRWTDNFEKEINNYNTEEYWSSKLLERGFECKSSNKIYKNSYNPFDNYIKAYVKK